MLNALFNQIIRFWQVFGWFIFIIFHLLSGNQEVACFTAEFNF